MKEYLTDDELLNFIADVEKNELVTAPPDIKDSVLGRIRRKRVAEYKRFRNRVVVAVAAMLAIVIVTPEWMKQNRETISAYLQKNYSPIYFEETGILAGLGDNYFISNFVNEREE